MRIAELSVLEAKAMGSYFRRGARLQPGNVETKVVDGETFVLLSNVNGILAVFREGPKTKYGTRRVMPVESKRRLAKLFKAMRRAA
jgi:hypothetical protein